MFYKYQQNEDWQPNLHGRLALIILYDQISRIIFRGTRQAFMYDEIAL